MPQQKQTVSSPCTHWCPFLKSRDDNTTLSCSVPKKKKTSRKLHSKKGNPNLKNPTNQKAPTRTKPLILPALQLPGSHTSQNRSPQREHEMLSPAHTESLHSHSNEHLAATRRLGLVVVSLAVNWRLLGTPSPGRGWNRSVQGTVRYELKFTVGCEGRLPVPPALSQNEKNFQKSCYIPFKLPNIPLKHLHSLCSRLSSSSSTTFHC